LSEIVGPFRKFEIKLYNDKIELSVIETLQGIDYLSDIPNSLRSLNDFKRPQVRPR